MKYISTRGDAAPVDFTEAILAGLAPDGGLYIPETWPEIAPAKVNESYVSVASRVIQAFAGEALPGSVIDQICEKAYGAFSHHSVAPLVQDGPNSFVMELHHGPTLAFKDVAMQLIAQLFDYVLGQRGQRLSVVCATSGDTGGAAAAAFANIANVDMFILHPDKRVSPIQRMFMTTTGAENVHNFAIEGDFDNCQAIVKAMFADKAFSAEVGLSAVNSINWARIAAQCVYYATAQAALGPQRALRFVVPSGNMGDALAGYVAARCGLLHGFEATCAVNENRALHELISEGVMNRMSAVATPSPAMDISVPSNFERLLFEISGRDAATVRQVYEQFAQSGEVILPDAVNSRMGCSGFSSQTVSNEDTTAEMVRYLAMTGATICPHTAVGTAAARRLPISETTTVVLSTAHAAKFPETVKEATGRDVPLPERAKALLDLEEVYDHVAPSTEAVKAKISELCKH